MIGYCPQENALLDNLTVKEHLYLFGEIKGIRRKILSFQVNKLIN